MHGRKKGARSYQNSPKRGPGVWKGGGLWGAPLLIQFPTGYGKVRPYWGTKTRAGRAGLSRSARLHAVRGVSKRVAAAPVVRAPSPRLSNSTSSRAHRSEPLSVERDPPRALLRAREYRLRSPLGSGGSGGGDGSGNRASHSRS